MKQGAGDTSLRSAGKVDIYYFSGTGNTLMAAEVVAKALRGSGTKVRLLRMEKHAPENVDTSHPIGLAFPVAIFSTFPLVWRFVRNLPKASGTQVFVIDTLAGISGGALGPLRRVLRRKGYNPVAAVEICMPGNIFWVMADDWNRKRQEQGLQRAASFAADLLAGKGQWRVRPLVSDLIGAFSQLLLRTTTWRIHQKLLRFQVDKDRCTGCGQCARLCPVDNITMQETPVFDLRCEYCLRCVSLCPHKAIKSRLHRGQRTYRAVKSSEMLKQRN